MVDDETGHMEATITVTGNKRLRIILRSSGSGYMTASSPVSMMRPDCSRACAGSPGYGDITLGVYRWKLRLLPPKRERENHETNRSYPNIDSLARHSSDSPCAPAGNRARSEFGTSCNTPLCIHHQDIQGGDRTDAAMGPIQVSIAVASKKITKVIVVASSHTDRSVSIQS